MFRVIHAPPLRRVAVFALAAGSLLLAGCGGASSSAGNTPLPVPPVAYANQDLTGNYYFSFAGGTAAVDGLLGALSGTGAAVSGTFRVNDPQHSPPCIPATQDIAFSGTVDSSDVLTLTSASFAGSVATLKVQLPFSKGLANGTGAISGLACTFPSTSVLAEQGASVTGNFVGTLALNPNSGSGAGPSGPATLVLTESSANADGQFPVTGTLSYSSSNCTVSMTLSGILTGPFINLTGSLSGAHISGVVPNPLTGFTANNVTLYIPPSTPGCASGFYGGPLTPQ